MVSVRIHDFGEKISEADLEIMTAGAGKGLALLCRDVAGLVGRLFAGSRNTTEKPRVQA